MTEPYGTKAERFPSVPFIIMMNRAVLVVVASAAMLASKEGINFEVSKWVVIPSATVLISSFCQYESLLYVTFPIQVVFKSGKIVPTMVVNTVLNRVWQHWTDYFLALVITGCIMGFTLLSGQAGNIPGGTVRDTSIGIALLCVFLLCDSLTSNTEKWIFNKDEEYSNTQMMFAMGVVCLFYSIILTAATDGGFPAIYDFLCRNPDSMVQVVALSLCSTFGQGVIYYTVKTHGPVLLAVMMTVRQTVSVFISAALYDHNIPPGAIGCVVGAFLACLSKPIYQYFAAKRTGGLTGDARADEKQPTK